MKILYTKKFNKDLDHIPNDIKLLNDSLEMLRILHRKDIYRRFP